MFKNKLPLIIGQAELMFWQFRYVLGWGGGGGDSRGGGRGRKTILVM